MATNVPIRINIALVPNKIFKNMIEKKTYFVNEIIIKEQIWKPKAINRPVEANSTILDLSKELIMPLPQIVLKSQALSTFASIITSSALSSSIVLLFKIIYGTLTVDTVFSSSFTLFARASLLVDGIKMLLEDLQD